MADQVHTTALSRRHFFSRSAALPVALSAGAGCATALTMMNERPATRPVFDDGPLLADDVTGTTAYADWAAGRAKIKFYH